MRCKHCKDKFIQKRFLQPYCMEKDECISAFLVEMRSNNQKKEKKEWQIKKKIIQEKIKSYTDWLNELQVVFNKFIRLRDEDLPCISCSKFFRKEQYDAGHFWPSGNYKGLTVNEDNVHKQCSFFCNKTKSGNLGEYRINLIMKIGPERVQALDDNRHNKIELTIDGIKEKIKYYKVKVAELEKNAGNDIKT